MPPPPPPPPTPRIPTPLALRLIATLAIATLGCTRTVVRTVPTPPIPCLAIPPPEPPPVGADVRAMSEYRAQLTGYAWAAWDACGPGDARP